MSAYAYTPSPTPAAEPRLGWFTRFVSWLDERGPLAWAALLVASFLFAGPFGLMVLGYVLFTGRFRSRNGRARAMGEGFQRCAARMNVHVSRQTGNRAFDAYKADTLARLEREQDEFEAFLIRLREARDKAEFDQYMDERARAAAEAPVPVAPEAVTEKAARTEN